MGASFGDRVGASCFLTCVSEWIGFGFLLLLLTVGGGVGTGATGEGVLAPFNPQNGLVSTFGSIGLHPLLLQEHSG